MDERNLEVRGFLYHKTPSGELAVHSSTGIVLVGDQSMQQFILNLETEGKREVSSESLQNWFGERSLAAEQFLIQYDILRRRLGFNFDVQEVEFATNCPGVGEVVTSAFDGVPTWKYAEFSDAGRLKEIVQGVENRPVAFVTFLSPYSRRLARIIRDGLLRSKDTILLTSYMYNGALYIDSLYQEKWRVPCHFCQINQVESDLRFGLVKRVTYQKIIDQLYEYEADFEVQTPLSPRWRLNVATQLVNRIDRLITASNGDRITLDEIGTAHVFNLNTMQEYQDVTTHWELCDCYE